MNEFLILVAYYDKGNSFRRRNLTAVVSNYLERFPECDICITEQNSSDIMDVLPKDDRVKHVVTTLDDIFHKPILLNNAVRAYPDYRTYVMGDADAYLDDAAIDYIREHWSDASLVFPYSDVLYLNETDTRRIVTGQELTPGEKSHGVQICRQTGLCNTFTKATFDSVGGFDEEFDAWGAEDDAFLVKCSRRVGPIKRNAGSSGMVYHLFHPVVNTSSYVKSSTYLANRKRCACVRRMDDEDLDMYVSGKTTLAKLVAKYERAGRLSVKLEWKCTRQASLSIDTTIYDINMDGEMTFSKIIDEVVKEDGADYAVTFIDTILKPIPDLNTDQLKELNSYRDRLCNLSKT